MPRALCALALLLAAPPRATSHDGPPYPIVTNRMAGAYIVSIWTDPDTTDDGSAGGQFWIILAPGDPASDVPGDTRVSVTIHPVGEPGGALTALAVPERGDASRQFAALPMGHEGRFQVRVTVESGLGTATVESEADATYDERPPPVMLVVYAVPFLLAGVLWLNLIVRRRRYVNRTPSTRKETSRE